MDKKIPDENSAANKEKESVGIEPGTADSPSLPLFYSQPEPLDTSKHKNLGLLDDFGLGFTAKVNSVPVNMVELPQLCHTYPVIFGFGAEAPLVAILGIRDNENLFLDDENKWASDAYIPAYIRRYPFIFSEMEGADTLTLCIDFNDKVVSEKAERKFFDDDGKPTELSQTAVEFCKSYHAAALQSLEFSKAILAEGLLVESAVEIEVTKGKRINFSGYRVIDEVRLEQMPDSVFLEWRKKGWLPYLYAHLLSSMQWQGLARRLNCGLRGKVTVQNGKSLTDIFPGFPGE